jgi:hypothetical protein
VGITHTIIQRANIKFVTPQTLWVNIDYSTLCCFSWTFFLSYILPFTQWIFVFENLFFTLTWLIYFKAIYSSNMSSNTPWRYCTHECGGGEGGEHCRLVQDSFDCDWWRVLPWESKIPPLVSQRLAQTTWKWNRKK